MTPEQPATTKPFDDGKSKPRDGYGRKLNDGGKFAEEEGGVGGLDPIQELSQSIRREQLSLQHFEESLLRTSHPQTLSPRAGEETMTKDEKQKPVAQKSQPEPSTIPAPKPKATQIGTTSRRQAN